MTDASKKTEGDAEKKAGLAFDQEILEITGDDILEFFEELNPDGCCPVCKHDLRIMAAIKHDGDGAHKEFLQRPAIVGMPIHEYPEKGSTYKTPCFVASCEKCGHINYFMATPVLKWKKSHGDKG